jgi:non-canonical purine NTP pyrophosphatase (RdgB/HAM1 family)
MNVTLITGNQGKADQLAKWLGQPIEHVKVDLHEIQSLELKQIVEHKARQAYEIVKKPVLVEDVELRCNSLQGLPGPFIKWFLADDVGLLCRMLNSFADRGATARVMYAYCGSEGVEYFEGSTEGVIADFPKGTGGFGWDSIFAPHGYSQTRAELNEQDYEITSPRAKAIMELKEFLNRA